MILCKLPVIEECIVLIFILCSGVSEASSCKALSSFYSYKSTTIRSELDGVACLPYSDQPYVLCDVGRLTDGDLGPECNLTGQLDRFYIWDRMYSEGNPGEDRLLFQFRTTVSLTTIQLHYYSQLDEGIGLPILTFYAVDDAFLPWDAISSPSVTLLASTGPSVDGETPGLTTISIGLVNAAYKRLLVVITYSGSDNISLFYLSEVEFFTCDPGSPTNTSPVQCTPPSSSSVIVSSIPTVTAVTSTIPTVTAVTSTIPTITAVTSTIPTVTNHPLSTSDSDLKLKSAAVPTIPTVTAVTSTIPTVTNCPLSTSDLKLKSTSMPTPVLTTCECFDDNCSHIPWIVTTAIFAILFIGLLATNIAFLSVKHLRKTAPSGSTKNSAMEMVGNPSYAPSAQLGQPGEPPHVYEAI